MNQAQIAELLEAPLDVVVKAISVTEHDHLDKAKSYSTDQVADIEMIVGWMTNQKMSNKLCKEQYTAYKIKKDPLASLPLKEREIIEKVLDEIAGQSGEAFTNILQTRRNEILGALLQRFDRAMVKDIVGVVQSSEFKKNFGKLLLTGDRAVLPGKSVESLPSSKVGATNS